MPKRHGIFFAKEVCVISGTVFLTAPGRSEQLDRSAAARREDRRERPSAQSPSHESILSLIKGRLVHKEGVVHELAVNVLNAIHRIGVESIVRSEFTGGLNQRRRAQGLRPGEVRLHRQSPPVRHLNGGETSVVVPEAYAG